MNLAAFLPQWPARWQDAAGPQDNGTNMCQHNHPYLHHRRRHPYQNPHQQQNQRPHRPHHHPYHHPHQHPHHPPHDALHHPHHRPHHRHHHCHHPRHHPHHHPHHHLHLLHPPQHPKSILGILIEMIEPRSLRKQFSSKASDLQKSPRKLSKLEKNRQMFVWTGMRHELIFQDLARELLLYELRTKLFVWGKCHHQMWGVPYRLSGFWMFGTSTSKQKHAIYIVG